MSEKFEQSLLRLPAEEAHALLDDLYSYEGDEVFEGFVPEIEAFAGGPEEEPIPRGLLSGEPRSACEVMAYVRQIEPVWRLDAISALQDYLSDLDELPGIWERVKKLFAR